MVEPLKDFITPPPAGDNSQHEIHQPAETKYLPLGFFEQAPTGSVEELKTWLDENMFKGISEEIKSQMDFWPVEHATTQPFMHEVAVKQLEKEAQTVFFVLDQYVSKLFLMYHNKGEDEEIKKYKERAIGVSSVAQMLGLESELHVIEQLFVKAASVPSAIEHPRAETPPNL